jgi:UDP-N-acetylmuramate--alanine ligase
VNRVDLENSIKKLGFAPDRWLLVTTGDQTVTLIEGRKPTAAWPVSTAAVGLDARQDSGGTPPGIHRIHDRIGGGAPGGTVFASREPTGERWRGEDDPRDLILDRILTLEGCEEGVNRGPGVDSLARYIYLHGTNHAGRIGEPCSHGCIRLRPADMVDLFDRVAVGDPVVIT